MNPVRNFVIAGSKNDISNGVNRPFLAAFICLACGILLASFIKTSLYLSLFIAAIAIIFSILLRNRNRPIFIISILISIIFLGAACLYNSTFIPSNHIANQISKTQDKTYLKGCIVSDPLHYEKFWGRRTTTFILEVDYYKQDNTWLKSQGLCKTFIHNSDRDYSYGQNLILFGNLESPPPAANPGEFDYSGYLRQKKIYAIFRVDSSENTALSTREERPSLSALLKAKIFTLRKEVNRLIHIYLPRQEAELLSAMMLGLRSELPSESRDLFVQTGTAHILAISGLHLGIIAYILFFALGLLRLPYNIRAFLVIIIICCYAILCGGRPPVVRAAIMITIFLTARILNRDIDIYNILSLAGILILLGQPMQLFSAGFILSFICVFSIIYLSPRINLIKPLALSLAIYIGVVPIIAYHFNIVSPVTIIANLLVVPIAGLLLCAGMTFILFGFLSASLATIFGSAVWLIAFLLERIIFYLSRIPYAYFYIPDLPIWSIAGYYALIILATNRERFRLSKGAVFMIILAFINFCIWVPLLKKPTDQLKITFLHVGHGDAVFIQFPKGETMLVDAGFKNPQIDKGKDVVAPYIWHEGRNRIDCMLITHGDTDHFGGASSIIGRIKVRFFLHNGRYEGEKGYAQLLDSIRSRPIKTFSLKEGDRIEGIKDVQLLVLSPSKEFVKDYKINRNDSSVVLKLIYKNISFLLCGDILEKGIKNIIPYGELLKSDIIKVPHHGSALEEYTAESFYNLVDPDIAVIAASAKYSYYPTPAKSTVEVLSQKGSSIYITHQDGAITITTDGKSYNVTTTYTVERL